MLNQMKMLSTTTMNNAFAKKAGTVKARVAMAQEVAKRGGRMLSYAEGQALQAWAVEYATNWKAA